MKAWWRTAPPCERVVGDDGHFPLLEVSIDGPNSCHSRDTAVAEENAHELNGDGSVILNGEDVGTVYYWLSITPKPGRVVADGLISGPEPDLRRIKKANSSKLPLEDGPIAFVAKEGAMVLAG